ncbi:DUF1285 domain-containing protein [Pacificimonas sp. ICDLI1SI03]
MTSDEALTAPDTGTPISLSEVLKLAAAEKLPPVDTWHPDRTGDSEMRIASDGTWYHQGDPIRRKRLVRLFSRILRRDGDEYVLVTPAEKLSIIVEDVPFVAVEVAMDEGRVVFRLNTGDFVEVDAEHPLTMRGDVPYVHVRSGLDARVARAPWYRLAEAVVERGGSTGIVANGHFFPLA